MDAVDSVVDSRRRWLGPLVSVVVLGLLLVPVEWVLRWRYGEPARETSAEVAAIQAQLVLDSAIGFRWKADVSPGDGVALRVRDVAFAPLSTDGAGFKNVAAAIGRVAAGEHPAAIGLGDSFMEHGHAVFFERFAEREIFYYNRAIHRQTAAQYTAILKDSLATLQPRVAVYGLFENDFAEAEDFVNWQRSGMDWFAFHSGTWCGAPVIANGVQRIAAEQTRGFRGLTGVIRSRLRGDRMTVSGPSAVQVGLVVAALNEAVAIASHEGIGFVLALIPSRATAVDGNTLEADAYDDVIASVGPHVYVVDLRATFQSHAEPASLYYVDDAHWNARGMALAADAIVPVCVELLGRAE